MTSHIKKPKLSSLAATLEAKNILKTGADLIKTNMKAPRQIGKKTRRKRTQEKLLSPKK